jgi:hypothetical protein
VAALEPLEGLYTFLCTRLGEKFIKLLLGWLGWLPRPWRWPVARVLGLPGQFLYVWPGPAARSPGAPGRSGLGGTGPEGGHPL